MRRWSEWITVFLTGGVLYSMVEIVFRGYTHWSMTLTGGVCFMAMYALHIYGAPLPFSLRCLLGAITVTAAELAAGCIVNLWLGWEVWDYSGRPLNLLGQICPLFSLFWFVLSALAAPLCRRLHRMICPEKNSCSSCISGKAVL